MLIAALAEKGLINPKMSVLSAFMCFLNAVSTMSLANSTCFPVPFNASILGPVSFSSDVQDSSNYFAFWRVSESSFEQIRQLAASSLAMLQRSPSYETIGADSCFSKVFLSKTSFLLEYDFLLHIPLVKRNNPVNHESFCGIDEGANDYTDWQYVTNMARALLIKALGNRVLCVHSYQCISMGYYFVFYFVVI